MSGQIGVGVSDDGTQVVVQTVDNVTQMSSVISLQPRFAIQVAMRIIATAVQIYEKDTPKDTPKEVPDDGAERP